MADDSSGGVSVPDTDNWDEWTFEQALKALTGEGGDLHTPAKATFFNFNPSPSASDTITYHAWGDYYYGVNINNDAVNAWATAVATFNDMMPDVARGKRGSMNAQTLKDLQNAIIDFGIFTDYMAAGMNSWATRLDSDDSEFKGKAAFLIYWRLKASGDGLTDSYEQVATRHGRPIADIVGDAATQLGTFNTNMSTAWTNASDIANWVNDALRDAINAVAGYIDDSGLQLGTSNYQLNNFMFDVNSGKDFIRHMLSTYSLGDLTSASGWQSISNKINTDLVAKLKDQLDTTAHTEIGALAPKYSLATSSLIEITAPPAETPPRVDTPPPDGPPDGSGDGNIPPPPDGGGDGNVPPPPDGGGGGNIPPPDGGGGGNIPPPDGGGGGLPPPDGGGGGNDLPSPDGGGGLPPPDGGGGGNGLPLPDGGGGGSGLPSPDGGGGGGLPGDGGGNGAFVPGLVPPGGGVGGGGEDANGRNSDGLGGDGAFDENGPGDGLVTPPEGGTGDGDSVLPPGAGSSGTKLPPGAGGGVGGGAGGKNEIGSPAGGGFGADPGKGFGSGAGLGNGAGGGSGGLGDGFGGANGGLGGANGGLGGANGGLGGGLGGAGGGLGGGLGGAGGAGLGGGLGGGSDALGGVPSQLTGGSPGADGAPGSSSGGGDGGVPFFPPMMGGAGGAGGEKPQERERQTWLSEDEEIWGTRVDVGSGVIGRLDEEEYELEEVPLAGPARRQRRADSPRRPRPAEQTEQTEQAGQPEREAGTAGEEATGSA